MAKWVEDPQAREEVEHVTEELKLPIYKASTKGKFRPWLTEVWNKIEDYCLLLKKETEDLKATDNNIKDNRWRLYSKVLANGTDLNTVQELGRYYSDSSSNDFTNMPVNGDKAFMLIVESATPQVPNKYLTQTFKDFQDNRIYRRVMVDYVWKPWQLIGDDSDRKWTVDNGVDSRTKGIFNNNVGIYIGANDEINFEAAGEYLLLNYRAKKSGTKIKEFKFLAGEGSNSYAKITAGDIVSNGSLVLTEKYCPYAVGDIYETTNTTNPATRWVGTTWQKIEGRFLRATNGSEAAGTTGGSDTKTLTVDNLAPHTHSASTNSTGAHTHTQSSHTHTQPTHEHTMKVERSGEGGWQNRQRAANGDAFEINMVWKTDPAGGENTGSAQPAIQSAGEHTHTVSVSNTGSGTAFDIKPAYYTVHIWKRVS